MTTAQVVEMSVTVNNNSPIQDYVHPDDQTQPTFEMTPGSNLSPIIYKIMNIYQHLIVWRNQQKKFSRKNIKQKQNKNWNIYHAIYLTWLADIPLFHYLKLWRSLCNSLLYL